MSAGYRMDQKKESGKVKIISCSDETREEITLDIIATRLFRVHESKPQALQLDGR